VKISRAGQKISKNAIFGQIFLFSDKKNLGGGGSRLMIFSGGDSRLSTPLPPPPPGIMYENKTFSINNINSQVVFRYLSNLILISSIKVRTWFDFEKYFLVHLNLYYLFLQNNPVEN
jgi:hypothetical protein